MIICEDSSFTCGKQDFNHGVEFILLISVIESAFGKPVEDALDTLTNLIAQFGSLIVQATQGLLTLIFSYYPQLCRS